MRFSFPHAVGAIVDHLFADLGRPTPIWVRSLVAYEDDNRRALEDALNDVGPGGVNGFYLAGVVIVSSSGEMPFSETTTLAGAYCNLTISGGSTDVEAFKNGSSLGSVTISGSSALLSFAPTEFRAASDTLRFDVTTAGSGAEGLAIVPLPA